MTFSSRHIYDHYRKRGGQLPYSLFLKAISRFNELAVGEMLRGRDFPLGSRLSRLTIVRIKRRFSHRLAVDWPSSYRLRSEIIARGGTPRKGDNGGEDWLVYHTDDWYCRFFWDKRKSRVKNTMYYRFDPTRGAAGNKSRLVHLLTHDELAHLRFRLFE